MMLLKERLKNALLAGFIALCLSIIVFGILIGAIYVIDPNFPKMYILERFSFTCAGITIGNFLGVLIFSDN